MRKPTFGVTALAVVTLSLLGVFRVAYEPLLPPSPTEYLVSVPSTEPQPAPIVEINWKKTIEQGRVEAKRRKVGLLILLLDPSNSYAKQLELKVFRDPEMARFVNRSFVPVKINLAQYPDWGQITLPTERLTKYVEPGVELLIADLEGDLVGRYVIENPFQYFGPESILPFLIDSKSNLNKGLSFIQTPQSLQSLQDSNIRELIVSAAEPLPAFSNFVAGLRETIKTGETGRLKPGSTKVNPMGLRLLAKLGSVPFSSTTLKELACTPLYDAIDSGFYREARITPNSSYIDTGKSSSHNALIAQIAAQLGCASKDPDLLQLSVDIGNEVIVDYLDGDSIATFRMNDQSVDNRSVRSSLTEKKLGSILSRDQRNSLMSYVSKSQSPEQDLVSLKNLSVLSNPDFIKVRQSLRESLRSVPGLSEPEHIAVTGYIAARLFELHRYTGDPRFLAKAEELAEVSFSALGTNSVSKIYGSRELGPGWLASYLSIADCGLARYAVTGEIYPLRKGEIALKLAISKFRNAETGLLNNIAEIKTPGIANLSSVPDLADRGRESLNSQAIRLAFHYSVTSESEVSRGEFLAFAQSLMVRLNYQMRSANVLASGYYDAVFDVTQNISIMVMGPNRVQISNKLAKIHPFKMIYPMTVKNAPSTDLLYIRRGDSLEGPYSVDEIQKKLSELSGS
jgi:hypothetical protein